MNISDETEEHGEPDRAEVSSGRPILATTICAVLLIGSCVGSRANPAATTAPSDLATTLGYIAGGILIAALFWGIAYALTIRRASSAWKAGSLFFLLALGAVTSLARIATSAGPARADTDAIANQLDSVIANSNTQGTVQDHDAGPISRLGAFWINRQVGAVRTYDQAAQAAGLLAVTSFGGLTKTSPALDHCDRLANLQKVATGNRNRFAKDVDDLRAKGEAEVAQNKLSQANLDGFLRGVANAGEGNARLWTLKGQFASDAAAMCRILARRRWASASEGKVLFTDDGDLAEAQPILADAAKVSAALLALQADAKKDVQSSIKAVRQR